MACAGKKNAHITPEKSPSDTREYRHITLDNGLRALLVRSDEVERAAVAVTVMAGSGDDPREYQGLAHFLEHMLFLGTERHPEVDGYQKFIIANGGTYNAFTGFDYTTYFFEVKGDALPEGVERLAQFFIAPLMDKRYVDRERNAVDSEYRLGLRRDDRRKMDVLAQMFNPENPYAKFNVGSLQTLRGEGLYGALWDFYRRHYRTGNMRLVIFSSHALDALEDMVRGHFRAVPEGGGERAEAPPLFLPESLPFRAVATPLRESRGLEILFPIPDPKVDRYKRKWRIIGHLLGHEGEGSLLSLLKRRGWANSLSAGLTLAYKGGAAFHVGIGLTEEGVRRADEITGLVFSALDRIKKQGIAPWRYEELKTMAELRFRFLPQSQPAQAALSLVARMREYGPDEVLSAPYRFDDFDAVAAARALSRLTPANFVSLLFVPEGEGPARSGKTHWYETPYAVSPVPQEQVRAWHDAPRPPTLYLPEPNPFIPEDVSVLSPAGKKEQPPELIYRDERLRLWHRQDEQYSLPFNDIRLRLFFPTAKDTLENKTRRALYLGMLNESFAEYGYAARQAGLHYSFGASKGGIGLSVGGYSDKQADLLKRMLSHLRAPLDDEKTFARLRDNRLRQLRNLKEEMPHQSHNRRLGQLLGVGNWPQEKALPATEALSLADVRAFARTAAATWNADMLVHGNVSKSGALVLAQILRPSLPASTVPRPVRELVHLVPSRPLRYEEKLPHNDASVMLYLQAPNYGLETRLTLGLTARILSSDFFHELRTEKQFGYVVYARPSPRLDLGGLVLVVTSPNRDAGEIERHMREFLRDFLERKGPELERELFEKQRDGLADLMAREPKNLGEWTGRWWGAIVEHNADFGRYKKRVGLVREMTYPKWRDFYRKHIQEKAGAGEILLVAPGKDGELTQGPNVLHKNPEEAWRLYPHYRINYNRL